MTDRPLTPALSLQQAWRRGVSVNSGSMLGVVLIAATVGNTGRGSSSDTSNRASMIARIVIASAVANEAPRQMRGPAPNGMKFFAGLILAAGEAEGHEGAGRFPETVMAMDDPGADHHIRTGRDVDVANPVRPEGGAQHVWRRRVEADHSHRARRNAGQAR